MIDFEKLEHETRCYALVGFYLKRWSVMEAALELCLKAALRVPDDSLRIVCHHLDFSGKVYIVRCVLEAAVPEQTPEKARLKKLLADIGSAAADRNLIAHSPFEHDSGDDGVVFVEIKARSKYTNERSSWPIKMFQEKFLQLTNFAGELKLLAGLLEKHQMTEESSARAAASLGWQSTSSWEVARHVVRSQRRHISPTEGRLLSGGTGIPPE